MVSGGVLICAILPALGLGTIAARGSAAQAAEPEPRKAIEQGSQDRQGAGSKIRFRFSDGRTIAARVLDNPTARDFAGRLPLTLTLTDYAATEKIADLPDKLTTEGAPDGFEPKAGDLAFYAPWGNLAIFHRPFRYSAKLIRIGTLEGSAAAFAVPGPMTVTIERPE